MEPAPFLRWGSCEWRLGLRERKVFVAVSPQTPTNSPLVPSVPGSGLPGSVGILLSRSRVVSRPRGQQILFIWPAVDGSEAFPRSKGAMPARESFLLEQLADFTRNWIDE